MSMIEEMEGGARDMLEGLRAIPWRALPGRLAPLLAMILLAQSEWRLALAVGWPPAVAWAAPASLDLYVTAAMLARRELLPAVLVSGASVLMSHAITAAPAAWSGGAPGAGHLVWKLAAACSVVPLLVFYRSHRLTHGAPAAGPVARALARLVARVTGEQPATPRPSTPRRRATPPPAPRHDEAPAAADGAADQAPAGEADQVLWVAERLRAGAPDTSTYWTEVTGWSKSTALRRVRQARELAGVGGAQ